jgi:hypothetical protein
MINSLWKFLIKYISSSSHSYALSSIALGLGIYGGLHTIKSKYFPSRYPLASHNTNLALGSLLVSSKYFLAFSLMSFITISSIFADLFQIYLAINHGQLHTSIKLFTELKSRSLMALHTNNVSILGDHTQ